MKTICFMNQKGGVAKSTTVTTTAKILADKGYRVLVVDLDQQGNCSRAVFNIDTDDVPTVLELIKGDNDASEVVQRSYSIPNPDEKAAKKVRYLRARTDRGVDVIPSDRSLSSLTLIGGNIAGVQIRLRRALREISGEYDFCLIDCPPAIGFESTIALSASDYVVILTTPAYFSTDGMLTIKDCVDEVKEWYNPDLKMLGILVTIYNTRTNISRRIADEISEFAEPFGTFRYDTKIRECVKVGEAHDLGLTVAEYSPDCNTSIDYRAFVDEMLHALGEQE